jgi:histidyl-tRNA synthetase
MTLPAPAHSNIAKNIRESLQSLYLLNESEMSERSPPGVFDILPEDPSEKWKSSYLWQYVEGAIRKIAKEYCLKEIRTPIFERTELFLRGVGETTDIVTKEMYTFLDKGERSITLRPEGTAPAMRAFIEHGLSNTSSLNKLFYIGPMFRYERAQAGRYRQHHQFGVEIIGVAEPEQDAEVISLLYNLYSRLGLKNLTVNVNSIGDAASRTAFKEALQSYLKQYFNELSQDSQVRFEKNPLRILDSKNPKDIEIVAGAPSILDFLNDESKKHFERVLQQLTLLGIPYQVNAKLVRGLDYYNQTVFEIVAGELGAQNSIGGGGRYDGLLKTLGGPDLPAFGFGTGIERIIQTLINQNVELPESDVPALFLIPLGDKAKEQVLVQAQRLRNRGIATLVDLSGKKLNKAMQLANTTGARFTAVIGDDEIQSGRLKLKDMKTGESVDTTFEQLPTLGVLC